MTLPVLITLGVAGHREAALAGGNVRRSCVIGVGNGIGRDGGTCLAALGNHSDVFSADVGARLS